MTYPRRLGLTGAICLAAMIGSGAAEAQPPGRKTSASAAPSPPKVFGGRVLEVDPKNTWFVMQGGGSKRYPRVRIQHDKKTRWTGIKAKAAKLKPGDSVRVNATLVKDITFKAVDVEVQDPNAQPVAGKLSGAVR
jgi:hypothetical protein